MAKHRDSGENAARDQVMHSLARFVRAANLRDDMTTSLGQQHMAQLDAGARRHERREQRRSK